MGIAVLYLDTPMQGTEATALARNLAAILNRYLPARLNEISDKPEGSIANPLRPDEEFLGTVSTGTGNLDIVVERVDRGKAGRLWLFSQKTLAAIPGAARESNVHTVESHLPEFLVTTRPLSVPLFEWIAVFGGIPLVFLLTGLLNRLVGWAIGELRRRILRTNDLRNPSILRAPIRLLLVAVFIRWMLSMIQLPLLARQTWSAISLLFTMTACIWLLLLLNGWGERYFVARRGLAGSASVLRLVRRVIDGLVLFAGLLLVLHLFGVNVTAGLAGLGIGGIAIALAAQKTLENVIAGVSLIADDAVRIGDTLNLGDVQGTVEEVGLRSIRIRTVDRTLVSLPNGQIANMKLETLSARDKFLFHPVVGLRYETTPEQLDSFMAGVRSLLNEHANVDSISVRVRFVRFGASSLDVDIFAYVFAHDWNNFLEIQEELLFGIRDTVRKAGAEFAFPSQSLYLAADKSDKIIEAIRDRGKRNKSDVLN